MYYQPEISPQAMPYIFRNSDNYDFIGESYQSYFPNLHRYPATMLPQIGNKLLQEFQCIGEVALDPFCGSGSSFIAPITQNFSKIYGFDCNYFATILSQARYYKYDMRHLQHDISLIVSQVKDVKINDEGDFWLPPSVLSTAQYIKERIMELPNKFHQYFILIALCEAFRKASYTRNEEFKLYRISQDKMPNHQQNLSAFFIESIKEKFEIQSKNQLITQNYEYNLKINNYSFDYLNQGIDCILTSPPYGDSKTTVAYGQFSYFANLLLGIPDAKLLDNKLLGGKKAQKLYENFSIAHEIKNIAQIDFKRACEVSAFYFDSENIVKKLVSQLNKNAMVFFVVGNRKVKNHILPTEVFFQEVFSELGLRHIKTITRKISNKTMPLLNAPSNIKGQTAHTMNNEFIVVLQKP